MIEMAYSLTCFEYDYFMIWSFSSAFLVLKNLGKLNNFYWIPSVCSTGGCCGPESVSGPLCTGQPAEALAAVCQVPSHRSRLKELIVRTCRKKVYDQVPSAGMSAGYECSRVLGGFQTI